MKIIILSANLFGLNLIKYILDNNLFNIDGLITLNKNSTTIMYDGVDLEEYKKLGIKKIYYIDRIGNEEKLIKELKPDMVLVIGWRQIIPNNVLSIPKYGFIGFHPTKLPIGRGPAPIINSILNNIKKSGITLFKYTDNVDEGDILFQEDFVINNNDYSYDVYIKMTIASFKILEKLGKSIKNNKIVFIPQENKKATYFTKITYKNNEITKNDNLEVFERKVRAFSYPYKGAYILLNNVKLILFKIKKDYKNKYLINDGIIENYNGDNMFLENEFIKLIILNKKIIVKNKHKIISGYLYFKNK